MTSSWGNSQQLERRPDIAGAERRLAAACAQIGVAEGGFFPVISLLGSAGYQGQIYSHLFTAPNEIWSVGAGALTPLFEAGKVRAQVRQARTAYDESLAGYRQTVLSAFQEVEDNLAAAAGSTPVSRSAKPPAATGGRRGTLRGDRRL
jgi:outer membrane protein TolC